MRISTKDWKNYIDKLGKLSDIAEEKMQDYVRKNGFADTEALIEYAYALVTKYGEGSAELACQMYDAVAEMAGVSVESAVPAETATYQETARAVQGSLLQSETVQKLSQVAARLVKQAGADTTIKNAIRDGAEWAWVPMGDTCAFYITLASRGWQYASKRVLKGNHAIHIHANCNCQFAIRFDGESGVAGYDPDKYYEMYRNAEGRSANDKINALRRERYAENKDKINAQKRAAYAQRKNALDGEQSKKTLFANNGNSSIMYADKKIDSYMENPKTLGDTTHKEKYDDFKAHGVDVRPLGRGSLKGKAYEDGGGYRVNGTKDGQYMQYHPYANSHHEGEYYKLCSGKTGAKRYNMNGDPKED